MGTHAPIRQSDVQLQRLEACSYQLIEELIRNLQSPRAIDSMVDVQLKVRFLRSVGRRFRQLVDRTFHELNGKSPVEVGEMNRASACWADFLEIQVRDVVGIPTTSRLMCMHTPIRRPASDFDDRFR